MERAPRVEPPIEVILFDLGNVILPFNHYPIAEKLATFSRNKHPLDPAHIFDYLFDRLHGSVNAYETGKISSEQFFQSLKRAFRLQIAFEEFASIWNDIFEENKEVTRMIRSLKGRKKLGLISNTNPLHFDYVLAKYPVLHLFDRWILSFEVGYKKPAPEIFRIAIDWASVAPEKILFIDDLKPHVDAAISLGMQGIQFLSSQQLRERLGDLLG